MQSPGKTGIIFPFSGKSAPSWPALSADSGPLERARELLVCLKFKKSGSMSNRFGNGMMGVVGGLLKNSEDQQGYRLGGVRHRSGPRGFLPDLGAMGLRGHVLRHATIRGI